MPLAAFAVGASAALVEARRRREETEELLGELEAAHAELRRYSARVRDLTVAEERARMAREMHDSVGHYLTVVNVGLENAQRFRTTRPDAAWEEVGQAKNLTREALAETRRWVRALKPLTLEDRAGPDAMAALARSFEGTGWAVGFDVAGAPRDLPGETELVLYRALQEGLTNALRHANAQRVRASLAFDDGDGGHVRLTVADDGRGAPDDTAGATREHPPDGGFGLAALHERAEAAGGTVSPASAPDGGFVLRVELPVEGR